MPLRLAHAAIKNDSHVYFCLQTPLHGASAMRRDILGQSSVMSIVNSSQTEPIDQPTLPHLELGKSSGKQTLRHAHLAH